MSTNQFEELQLRYLAGDSLSSQEEDSLLQWLGDNSDARQEMLVDEAIDSQLRCLTRVNDQVLAEEFVQQSVRRAMRAPKHEDIHIVVRSDESNRSRSLHAFRVLASVSAAALILVGIAYFTTLGRPRGDFGFAKITNEKNLSWQLIDEGKRRLRISSGSGEVHFENGTVTQLSAPAVIELRRPDNMFVQIGFVKVSVPPPAVGFTVETPTARIIDYGTKFNVDVDEVGQTETLVSSGVVTFETHSIGIPKSDPIKLTADGLNRASTKQSLRTGQLRSFATMASGEKGQFYGTIRADGKTVEFNNRQELVDFQNLLDSPLDGSTSPSREQGNLMDQTTGSNANAVVESGGTAEAATDVQIGNGTENHAEGSARAMLIEQLRSMQERHQGNGQMQQILERMIEQTEQVQPERSN